MVNNMCEECKEENLEWKCSPRMKSDKLIFTGKCKNCGKVYELFIFNDEGLYDQEKEEFVKLK